MKWSKQQPGPSSYKPVRKYKVYNGEIGKEEQCDFLSEIRYLGKLYKTGPVTYDNRTTKDKIMTRNPSWKIVNNDPEGKTKNWRPKKTDIPHAQTYDNIETKNKTMLRSQSAKFPKALCPKFTTEYSKNHKFVPGPGAHQPDKAKDIISKPYMKKRF